MRAEVEHLESAIGHRFSDRDLLDRALTHRSHSHEHVPARRRSRAQLDQEQLEFLGDSILGFVISELLMRHLPSAAEGRLSKVRAHLVSAAHLYHVALPLGLGGCLMLGRGEELSGGRIKKTLLVDGLEALIAALYLDGGLDVVRSFVDRFIIGDSLAELANAPMSAGVDYKSALQELAQARKLPVPRYALLREQGPEHSKVFHIEARVGKEFSGHGEGNSKKAAAQAAARDVFDQMQASTGIPAE